MIYIDGFFFMKHILIFAVGDSSKRDMRLAAFHRVYRELRLPVSDHTIHVLNHTISQLKEES